MVLVLRMKNGIVLDIRWDQLPCINGVVIIPDNPKRRLGYMPRNPKSTEVNWLYTWIDHIIISNMIGINILLINLWM